MKANSTQQGQTEIGLIEHHGMAFAALGSSVRGRAVTGYTARSRRGHISLKRWSGGTMLDCRSSVVREWRLDGWASCALVFSLTGGRFIVGYALGKNGCLFRGELIESADYEEAEMAAIAESEFWIERDAEDEERFDAECESEED